MTYVRECNKFNSLNIYLEGLIQTVRSATKMQALSEELRRQGKRIVLVPTMGFLHEGHLSLMRIGKAQGDVLVASIFVNPTQFGPNEDFDSYPRHLERDLVLLRKEGVACVFTPSESELYPQNYQTYVRLESLPNHLCGLSRPVFFTGVATVVCKLFHLVKPHAAVFGEKDYQQLVIIRRMVRDLHFGIDIIAAPTVREPDGLAMSSRNSYLTAEQRPAALSIYQSLQTAKQMVKDRVCQASSIIEAARQHIGTFEENTVDYIAVTDPETLGDVMVVERPALMALAVKVGTTRLIDNALLIPGNTNQGN